MKKISLITLESQLEKIENIIDRREEKSISMKKVKNGKTLIKVKIF